MLLQTTYDGFRVKQNVVFIMSSSAVKNIE